MDKIIPVSIALAAVTAVRRLRCIQCLFFWSRVEIRLSVEKGAYCVSLQVGMQHGQNALILDQTNK